MAVGEMAQARTRVQKHRKRGSSLAACSCRPTVPGRKDMLHTEREMHSSHKTGKRILYYNCLTGHGRRPGRSLQTPQKHAMCAEALHKWSQLHACR